MPAALTGDDRSHDLQAPRLVLLPVGCRSEAASQRPETATPPLPPIGRASALVAVATPPLQQSHEAHSVADHDDGP
jgi:hypothetical protein